MSYKGIILAGGSGSRLHPLTLSVSKQLMPVYDKPMIYYPISTLMLAGIREILIITTPKDSKLFQSMLGDGSQWGVRLEYAIQEKPEGLTQAFLIGEKFIGNDPVCLILGDNIFYGHGLEVTLKNATRNLTGGTVFGYYVKDPERYGVVSFDEDGNVADLEEKPEYPKSNYAITGLYFFDSNVVDIARCIKPSKRGELEITDVIMQYLNQEQLKVVKLGRGSAWLDTGTHQSLLAAANFIQVVEERQGLKISCPEEIAYRMGYIDEKDLEKLAQPLLKNGYGKYLINVLKRPI